MRMLWILGLLMACGTAELERGAAYGECAAEDCGAHELEERDRCTVPEGDECDDGEKCTIGYPDDPNSRTRLVCDEVLSDGQDGDTCTVFHTGQDDCDEGHYCWGGRCRVLCDPGAAKACAKVGVDDGTCEVLLDNAGVCQHACDPMDASTCDAEHNCVKGAYEYYCVPASPWPDPGKTCIGDDDCPVDHSCVNAEDGGSECRPRCNSATGEGCNDGEVCEHANVPGYARLGVCRPEE